MDDSDEAKLLIDARHGDQSAIVKAIFKLRTSIADLDINLCRLLEAIHTLDKLLVIFTVVLVLLAIAQIWIAVR